jgi:hypothetical protein
MFPEYEDFRLHPWNRAVLTARQHFIAHLILSKAYLDSKSCAWAITGMIKKSSKHQKLLLDYIKI